jgi:hypothetical protein
MVAIPPRQLVAPRRSRNLLFSKVTDPEDPPLRPERHIPNSITTMRRRLIDALVSFLPRCPCCHARPPKAAYAYDAVRLEQRTVIARELRWVTQPTE